MTIMFNLCMVCARLQKLLIGHPTIYVIQHTFHLRRHKVIIKNGSFIYSFTLSFQEFFKMPVCTDTIPLL